MGELGSNITNKTLELEEELKSRGLWQKEIPIWVQGYNDNPNSTRADFGQWLQFIFIPNHLHKNEIMLVAEKIFIVPHAMKYFGDDVTKGKLLQILIEIDSLL